MKLYLKIFIALVLIVGTLFWAVSSLRPLSYSGTDLKLDVGAGAVTVTNPSEVLVPVQLISPGVRVFAVTSSIAGMAGSSITQGTGNDRAQVFDLALPFGTSEFTVTRGTNVSLVANAGTNLQVTVQPVLASDAQATVIIAAIVILGALFYISKTTDHRWIPILGRKLASDRAAKLSPISERCKWARSGSTGVWRQPGVGFGVIQVSTSSFRRQGNCGVINAEKENESWIWDRWVGSRG